jgi:succinate dehydrogenase / fumarate reductase iron-sulfur subunit
MKIHLKIWRQDSPDAKGEMKDYELDEVSADMSFLEMMDLLNESLIQKSERVVEFDHDCREGICGQCGMMINGRAHGPLTNTTTCQLHMRSFKDGDTIYIEPFRAKAFPIVRDLKVDRKALDKIIQVGGFISASTGQAAEANGILIPHALAESAFDAAACIGCGACVATCKNSSAERVIAMVDQMDAEGFGHCSNTEACEVECPQEISVLHIARMNYEYNKALLS